MNIKSSYSQRPIPPGRYPVVIEALAELGMHKNGDYSQRKIGVDFRIYDLSNDGRWIRTSESIPKVVTLSINEKSTLYKIFQATVGEPRSDSSPADILGKSLAVTVITGSKWPRIESYQTLEEAIEPQMVQLFELSSYNEEDLLALPNLFRWMIERRIVEASTDG